MSIEGFALEPAATTGTDVSTGDVSAGDLAAVYDVPVRVVAVLGRTQMEVSELLTLKEGVVIDLDRKVGEAVDILVNDRLVARGELVLLENQLGITMTEIVKNDRV